MSHYFFKQQLFFFQNRDHQKYLDLFEDKIKKCRNHSVPQGKSEDQQLT
jgi:hypothetical protein